MWKRDEWVEWNQLERGMVEGSIGWLGCCSWRRCSRRWWVFMFLGEVVPAVAKDGNAGREAWSVGGEVAVVARVAVREAGDPVLLPGARRNDVVRFLRLRTWVDLDSEDGFARLVVWIKGEVSTWSASAKRCG